MFTDFRRTVMCTAHRLSQAAKLPFAISLRRVWQAYRLAKLMQQYPTAFSYLKKDGTVRFARGRLHPEHVAELNPVWRSGAFVYFDLDCLEYRSFQLKNLLCVMDAVTSSSTAGTLRVLHRRTPRSLDSAPLQRQQG